MPITKFKTNLTENLTVKGYNLKLNLTDMSRVKMIIMDLTLAAKTENDEYRPDIGSGERTDTMFLE